jgi:NADPH-dependent glutamate synthase beta subunit-like oxidoreductase
LRRHVFDSVEVASDTWPAVTDTGKKVAIIGSGPAGLSAAHFLRRKGHRTTIFEAAPEPGGMLRCGIPEYRLSREVLMRDLDLITGQGVEIRTSMALGHEIELETLREEGYDAVLVAAGVGAAKPLMVDGAERDGVLHGVGFLRDVSCGSFPASLLQRREVVVIGGGNVAVDAARTALRLGAASVTVACLEARDEMPAYSSEVEEAGLEGVAILNSWGPTKIVGDEAGISGVRFVRCLSVFNEAGRFAPTFDTDTTREIQGSVVITAIGQEVEQGLRDHPGLDFGGNGFLKVDRDDLRADHDDVFGSGDLVLGPSSVVQAVANARQAAESIDRFLGGDGLIPSILENERPSQWIGSAEGFAARARAAAETVAPEDRLTDFSEVEATIDAAAAMDEAGRCLQCDLRLDISPPVYPPLPWLNLSAEKVAGVPEGAGVYQLLGADHVALKIIGTPSLRQALLEELDADEPAPLFIYDEDPMYTKRESELIQQFLAQHGRMPDAGDELDDLF